MSFYVIVENRRKNKLLLIHYSTILANCTTCFVKYFVALLRSLFGLNFDHICEILEHEEFRKVKYSIFNYNNLKEIFYLDSA